MRSALLLGAASAAVASLSVPAAAQETTETVVVTGSRIPQTGLYSSSPVTAVGQQEMKFEGTTNVENLLNNLPSAFADFGSNESNGSVGTATVNLRNLGCNRTLVLVDGKRLMPGDNELPCADLNQIPAALIDHVEVVTGGASAVYGSDAVAGVVNFIMRRDFEGIEFDGQYSGNWHDNTNSFARGINAQGLGGNTPGTVPQAPGSVFDGEDVDGTIIMGANSPNGKGNVTAYAGFRNIQGVTEDARDFSACATSTTFSGSFRCGGSSTAARDGAGGRFISLNGAPCGDCTIDGTNGEVRGFTGADKFNFAPYNYLQRPDTRYTFGAQGHYEVDKALDFYGSTMFMDDHTVAQIAPSGLFFGTVAQVNCDNPFLGSAADPNSPETQFCGGDSGLGPTDNASLLIGRRNVEGGPRQDHLEHAAYRVLFGAKGDLGSGWSYDLSGQYGSTILSEEYTNDMSINRIQHSLQVVTDPATGNPTCKSALDQTDPFCVPWNIFQPGGVTPAAINYLDVPGFREGGTQEWVVSGNLTGDLGAWGVQSPWAKNPVALSVGGEFRQERLENRVDLEFQTGDLAGQGGPTESVHGGFGVSEGFGEIRVPIVQNMPFVEDLTANAGYRYSSYSIAGAVHSYKYGLEWQPIEDFRLRGSFQRAVRAPNVLELFTPASLGLAAGTQDLCAGSHPVLTLAQCENTGVTPDKYGSITQCVSGQCGALFSGNLALKPEISNTRELGLVFTPTFIDGFTATIDYFNIRLSGAIGTVPYDTILSQCATGIRPEFCTQIHRAPTSEILFGSGTQAGFIADPTVNTGALSTRGMDFEGNYSTDFATMGIGDYGGLNINFLGTWTDTFKNTPAPGLATYDCAGLFGITCGTPIPDWRHKLRVTWTSPWDFDLSLQWRHLSGVSFDGNSTDPTLSGNCTGIPGVPCNDKSDASIGAFDYFDIATNWTVHEGVQLHAGINNVFDKDPPLLDTNNLGVSSPPFGNGNTYPQVYDALGRYVFVGATIKY
ncbi:MAG TPA: TonB-dependent receptor [Rhizomicrobium sp.]|nr:TonB-dependent receptor [Rhizomicrobium sp.]